jgi:hypothetical protein
MSADSTHLTLRRSASANFDRSGCESWLEDRSNVDPKCPDEGISVVGGFLPIEQSSATGLDLDTLSDGQGKGEESSCTK